MKFGMKKQERMVILGMLVCALVAIIGYSLAYFVSGVKVTGNGATGNAKTAELPVVEYQAGDKGLALKDAYPGKSESKQFTVSYDGSGSEEIAITLKISTNQFVYCTSDIQSGLASQNKTCTINESPQLVIKLLKGDLVISDNEIDLTGKTEDILLAKDTISSNTDYTVVVEFKENNDDQSQNEGKNFVGLIEVAFADTEG